MAQIYISPHKKIGYSFLVLTVLMLAGLIFGLFSASYGAEIIIIPEPEEIDVNFPVSLGTNQEEENSIKAQILETVQEAEEKGKPRATVSMEDYAEGEIILTNNTWSPVNFVATTRFASPKGLIFRAVNKIHIPAKGQINCLVRADKMGQDYEIEPGKFTIPNLRSPNLKKNILAESKARMTGGLKTTGVIMQSDIDDAKTRLKEELYKKGLDEIESQLSESDLKIVTRSNILTEVCDALADEEKATFTVSTKMKIGAVAFKEKILLDMAVKALQGKIPRGKKLAAYEPDSLSYRLTEYDAANQTAVLEVQFRGYMIINRENEFLEKSRLRGLTSKEIEKYFRDFKEIKEVRIKLWPPFLKKTPDLTNKIKIKIIKDL